MSAERDPQHPHNGVIFDVESFEVAHDAKGNKVILARCHCNTTVSLRFAGVQGPPLSKAICAECGVAHCP